MAAQIKGGWVYNAGEKQTRPEKINEAAHEVTRELGGNECRSIGKVKIVKPLTWLYMKGFDTGGRC